MTPLLMIPGMMCDARLYGPQIAALSHKLPLMTVPITAADSVEALAADLLAQAPPEFALAGLSMGGIVAMEVVRQAPERVRRLALLDSNPLPESEEVRARREPQIEAVRNGKLREVMRDELKPLYLADTPRRAATLALCMEMALDLGASVFERQSRALQTRPDQQETLKAVRVPTLVLMGAEDRLCPLARHQLMHELIHGSKLVVVEGAGHLPTLEQPEAVNTALRSWLNLEEA